MIFPITSLAPRALRRGSRSSSACSLRRSLKRLHSGPSSPCYPQTRRGTHSNCNLSWPGSDSSARFPLSSPSGGRRSREHASNEARASNLSQDAVSPLERGSNVAIVLSACSFACHHCSSSLNNGGVRVSTLHQRNSPGNDYCPRGRTIDFGRRPYGSQQGGGAHLF